MSDIAATLSPTTRPGLWARLKAHVAGVNSAHARQLPFTPAMEAIARDCGLPVEVVLGVTAYDPALPFFYQRGYDRQD